MNRVHRLDEPCSPGITNAWTACDQGRPEPAVSLGESNQIANEAFYMDGDSHVEMMAENTKFRVEAKRAVAAGLALASLGLARGQDPFYTQVRSYFESHCLDCHDQSTAKGGLNLEEVKSVMAGEKELQRWTEIFDRVERGEMPPAKRERPEKEKTEAFLAWIRPRLESADASLREVVHRRLNREEYQNTLRDLLLVPTEVKELLPEDQSAGGFDNNGGALAVSAELMTGYLEAARRAIGEAIVTGPAPVTETFTAGPREELAPYLGKSYDFRDGFYYTFMDTRGDYSKMATRRRPATQPGLYRVKFRARTVNTAEPVTFSVVLTSREGDELKLRPQGYFEAGTEAKEFALEFHASGPSHLQVFVHGLPAWVNDPKLDRDAAIGFTDFEWNGPLITEWPPASHRKLLGSCDLVKGTREDAARVFREFMPRAFRGPVSEAEALRPLAVFDKAAAAGRPFREALTAGLTSILCSPRVLFLTELSAKQKRVYSHELGSRLSYFLWNSTPDDELLAAAQKGLLSRPEGLLGETRRLLSDPKSRRMVENFTGQWLKLRDIDATTPDSKLYPDFDEALQDSMVEESRAFFEYLLKNNLPVTYFIDSPFIMANRRLARHYGLGPVEGASLRPVNLPPGSLRGGVLAQGAVLKVTANGTNTSPVMRGVWVLENILGKRVPPPPPNIAGIEPDIRGATTIREQLDLHRHSESCAGCHQSIDPPGFALESFDPVGAYREHYLQFKVNPQFADKGWGSVVKAKAVDASGRTSDGMDFSNYLEFRQWLAAHPDRFALCLTDRLMTYALGREMGFSDRARLREIVEKTRAAGYGFRSLIENIVTSSLFSQP